MPSNETKGGTESAKPPVTVVFVHKENGPERLVAEAEIVFHAACGPLASLKLVGFTIWQSPDGDLYVTFPSRAFGVGNDRRYFDYLRTAEGDVSVVKALKTWIVDQFRASRVQA